MKQVNRINWLHIDWFSAAYCLWAGRLLATVIDLISITPNFVCISFSLSRNCSNCFIIRVWCICIAYKSLLLVAETFPFYPMASCIASTKFIDSLHLIHVGKSIKSDQPIVGSIPYSFFCTELIAYERKKIKQWATD